MQRGSVTGIRQFALAAAAFVVLGSSPLATWLAGQAPDAAVSVDTVSFASTGATIEAYLAQPKAMGRHPAIILTHDNRGLDDHARGIARRFASAGFVTLAPDLLSRIGGTAKRTPEDIMLALGQAMRDDAEDVARPAGRITPAQSVADVRMAMGFLQKAANVDASKISAVGLGWGAWRTFMLAQGAPAPQKAVVFYGSTPDSGLESITTPVLAHYARFDFVVTGNAVWTRQQLGTRFTYHIYPSARGFLNEAGDAYDEKSASLAWTRTLEFLRRSG